MKTARIRHEGQDRTVRVRDDGALESPDGVVLSADEVTWLPPPHGTVIGVALNHAAHVQALASLFREPPYHRPPATPVLFIKPENCITGHGALVQQPDGVSAIHTGPSLAVVIARTARRVAAADAFGFIKGYTILNDFTLAEQNYFRPPVRSKCHDSFGPLGPWVVDAADLADPGEVTLGTRVNGSLRAESSTRDLVRDVPALIEAITSFMTLNEDDVIATGFAPDRVAVASGDTVTVEASGIGSLTNIVVTEREYYASVRNLEAAA